MKKITYIKYSGSLELGNHLVYTSGSQDLRTRLFREILADDIQINIQSPMSVGTFKYLETNEGKKYFKLKNLKYNPAVTKVDTDTDLLIIESGSDNVMFETEYNGERIPAQAFANAVLKDYKGFVMYLQIDVALNFAFFPERLSNKFLKEFIHFGDYKDVFKDKNWLVVGPAKNVDLFAKNSNSSRANYDDLKNEGLIKIDNFEFHYCGIDFEEEVYKPQLKTKKNLLYIGGERNRIAKFDKYFNSVSEHFPTDVYGKWKPKTIDKFPNINFKGILERGRPRQLYNEYFGSVIIGDLKGEKVGCVTGRFFEVTTACSLPIIDADLLDTTISDIFTDELLEQLVVYDNESMENMLQLHNTQARVDLINECTEQMRRFSPNTSLKLLKKLYNKYKDGKKTNLIKLEELFIDKLLTKVEKKDMDDFTQAILEHHKLI